MIISAKTDKIKILINPSHIVRAEEYQDDVEDLIEGNSGKTLVKMSDGMEYVLCEDISVFHKRLTDGLQVQQDQQEVQQETL